MGPLGGGGLRVTDIKLAHTYTFEKTRYRLVPTHGEQVDLEINGTITARYNSTAEAKNAAYKDVQNKGSINWHKAEDMKNISRWSDGLVDLGPADD
jgi:hypothetical protein